MPLARLAWLLGLVVLAGCAERPADRAGTTLVFKHARILGPGNPIPALVADFQARHPGVRVVAESLPWNSDEQRQFFVINLESGRPGFDVMMLDVIWVPEFARAGWLLDLTPRLAPGELDAFFPSAARAAMHAGRAWALPWNMNVGLLYYRKDLLARHGLAPPETYGDLVAQAARIRAAERGARLDGFLWQGKQYEGLVVNVLEHLRASGTELLGPDGTLFPDPGRAEQALGFMRSLIETGVSPPWTTAADEELTRRAFGKGEAVFLRNWPYALDLLEAGDSPVRGRVGIAPLPRHPGGLLGAGSTGGAHLAIHRGTRHPDLAMDLVRTLTSAAAQRLHGDRRRALPDPHRAVPRARSRPGPARPPGDRRAHGGRSPAPRDALLPHDLHAAPARAVRRAREGEDPGAGDRRRAAGGGVRPARRGGAGDGAPVTGRERAARREGLLYLAPALAVLGALTVYPAIWVLWLSLQQRVPIFGIERFEGLRNYLFLLGDPRFWGAVRVTLVFTVTSVALEVALGVAVALALRAQRRGRRVALGLLLLAWALPAVVTAKVFEWLYHPAAGLANYLLGGAELNWLGDPALALPGLILADVWRTMPFVALLSYARLLGIAPEIYEAAQVDGAGRAATLRLITLPQLRSVLLIAVLFRTLDALRAFDLMFVLTRGGPAGTTETLTVYAYRSLFQTLQLGFGSAVSVVVFALVMLVAWLYLRVLRREGGLA